MRQNLSHYGSQPPCKEEKGSITRAHLVCGDALCRVHLQHEADQILGLHGNVFPVALVEIKLALHDQLKEHRVGFIVERRVPTQPVRMNGTMLRSWSGIEDRIKQDEGDHTKGPYIHVLAVSLLHENFRGWNRIINTRL